MLVSHFAAFLGKHPPVYWEKSFWLWILAEKAVSLYIRDYYYYGNNDSCNVWFKPQALLSPGSALTYIIVLLLLEQIQAIGEAVA